MFLEWILRGVYINYMLTTHLYCILLSSSLRQQLKTFKETKKHLRVPASTERGTKRPRAAGEEVDEETAKLGKWVKRQRRAFSTGKLAPERKAALDEIGFDFSPGAASKDERLAVQLGLLDELRKRRELSNAQVQDLNFLHGEWSRRGQEQISKPVLGAAKGSTGKGGNKFNIKWQESFEQLKEFSIKNGHTRVPQKHPDDKDGINPLGKWGECWFFVARSNHFLDCFSRIMSS